VADETDTTTEATETTTVEAVDETAADDSTILGGELQAEESTEATVEAEAAAVPPEKYELTASEGVTLDAETLAEADPVFRELGLTNDGAQKLIPIAEKFATRIATQAAEAANQQILSEVTAQRKAWVDEAKADPEIGGAKWDETVNLAAKALDALGYPKGHPFRTFLSETGLGNNVHMIAAMRKIGEMVGEDNDFVRGDAAVQVKTDRLAALYPNDVPNRETA
jgi:hypothetical protein